MSVFEYFDEEYEINPWQRLMLESLLLKKPDDDQLFLRFLKEVNLEALDFNSLRLIPALLNKFDALQYDTSFRSQMKGVYRHFQFRSSLLVANGRNIVEKLHDAGIDVLLFKGIAIALKYHGNVSNRPMGDIDVLIRRKNIAQAEEILHRLGFQYAYPEHKKCSDIHSHDYANANRSGFDLHWHSLSESPHAGIDDGIWRRVIVFDWDGLPVKVMSPEDLLLTGIINGTRERVIRPHWIHDVATIISAEPSIRWTIIWDEARKRGLREKLFNALVLVHGISAKTIPESLLQELVDNDLEFYRGLLQSAITEGRTHGLIHVRKDEIESILSAAGESTIRAAAASREANPVTGKAFGSPQHIRFFVDESSAINGLYLQWRHLPLIAELFEVNDRTLLDNLTSDHPAKGEGHLAVPAGLLATRPKPALPVYGARMSLVDAPSTLVLSPGQNAEITVEVENNTECCWPVCDGSKSPFGLTYHLLSEDGKPLAWNLPRCWLAVRRKGYVAFIEPSQTMVCKLTVAAPRETGRYILQIDLVHEGILYFSKMSHQFLSVDLEVVHGEPVRRFMISGSHIIHETLDDETVIIDALTGAYYTVNGYASLIWNAVVSGHSANRIVAGFAASDIFAGEDKAIEHFIDSLLSAKLVKPSGVDAAEPQDYFRLERRPEWQTPILVRHPEPRELIAMHPVRDVSGHAGWPYRANTAGLANKASPTR